MDIRAARKEQQAQKRRESVSSIFETVRGGGDMFGRSGRRQRNQADEKRNMKITDIQGKRKIIS